MKITMMRTYKYDPVIIKSEM